MTKHVSLSSVAHKNLRINAACSSAMGDSIMSCITVPTEYRKIQNHYPILFQLNKDRDELHSIALLGFERGENLFLKDDEWQASYKPLSIDIQPFLIGIPRNEGVDAQIHIDIDSPRVNEDTGFRVFDDQGKPTDYLESISDKLGALHRGYQWSNDFIQHLQKYKLLEPFVLEVTLQDSSENRLVGFHTINEKKLSELEGYALGELNERGYLMPIYMIVASLSNIAFMVERKNKLIANV